MPSMFCTKPFIVTPPVGKKAFTKIPEGEQKRGRVSPSPQALYLSCFLCFVAVLFSLLRVLFGLLRVPFGLLCVLFGLLVFARLVVDRRGMVCLGGFQVRIACIHVVLRRRMLWHGE